MRWLTLWGTLVALCFGAVCSAALYDTRRDAIEAARESTNNLGLLVATNVAHDIELLDLSLEAIALRQSGVPVGDVEQERRYLALFERAPVAKNMAMLVVLDKTGALITKSTSYSSRDVDFGDRDYFRVHQAVGGPALFISRPFVSRFTKLWTIAVSRRITLADGSFGGVVLGLLRVSHVRALFQQIDLGKHGALTLLRADGAVLTRFPVVANVMNSSVAESPLFASYPKAKTGHFESVGIPDGISRLYAFSQVGTFPLIVTVGMAKSDIYATWYQKATIIGLTMLASCLATVALVWMLRRELVRRVAAEKVANQNETLYRVLAENSVDTIAMSDAAGMVTYISPAIRDVLGWNPEEIEGKPLRDFVHAEYLSLFESVGHDTAAPHTLTFQALHRNGTWVWLEARVRVLQTEPGHQRHIFNIRDFSHRKKAEEELEAINAELMAMAVTDSLTGLSNRRRFDETLDREWRRALRDQTALALLLIDADHFKALNDHYGHQHGDQYLRAVAHIIQNCIRRPGDTSARYGGEEFAVLLPKTDIEGAMLVAEKIRLAVLSAQIPHIKSSEGVMTVSIGAFSQIPNDGLKAADLVKRADSALYMAKREGRNRTSAFTDEASLDAQTM